MAIGLISRLQQLPLPLPQSADEEHDFSPLFLKDAEQNENGNAQCDAKHPPRPNMVDRLSVRKEWFCAEPAASEELAISLR